MEKVAAAYTDGGTLGHAFATLVKEILEGFGLLYLDPLQPAIRKLSAPLLTGAAEQAPQLVEALRQRSAELESAGYHAQVLVEKDASLLFLLKGNKRLALRLADNRFVSREGDFSVQDLAAIADQISPNALLRPVLQDFLLPTVAYVAGPAEIAYFAQGSVLYQALLGRMPVIFPRNSYTLLDERAAKLMTRNQLRLPDLLDHREQVKGRIAQRLVPKSLTEEFKQVERTVTGSMAGLQKDLHNFDPTLELSSQKSLAKILYQLEKLQRKTARETLRRDEKASADAEYLLNLVYPHKHLQERLYSIVPFLAKYGLDLPRRLYEQAQLTCPDHMLRTF
jgi:bacillithiol synthase